MVDVSSGPTRRACGLSVLTLAGMVVPFALAGAQAATTGTISGRVSEVADNSPLQGARVQAVAVASRALAGSVTSSADGRYRLSALTPGRYAVVVSRIGYVRRAVDTVTVAAGGTVTLDVALREAPSTLNQVVTTASRGTPEKALEAPASIAVVSSEEIERRPAITTADLVRNLPGVNATQGGVAQTNIVVRGFNNAFSGSLLMLQDYRFAGVPSLRVNIPLLMTGTNDDIERVEVLLGPASALYGPNSGNGVLHVITKSPFASQGSSITLDGGNQSILRAGLRTAQRLSNSVAFKLSGEYFRGEDFVYRDRAEPERFPNSPLTPQARRNQPNARDYQLERYSGEARLDVRPGANTEAITTLGYSNVGNAIELTGANGASQIRNWTYTNLQQRFRWNRLFVQAFANLSDAGNRDSLDTGGTFLLRSGQPIVDQSRVYSAQVQHGARLGTTDFVYGADWIRTDPRSGGTINGRNEDIDRVTETGAYVQSTTGLGRKFDLLAAVRVDRNNVIEGAQFSPRAALVFKPSETNNLRVTYNRAFSTPANFAFFLDLIRQPLGGPYNVRAVGNPPKNGFDFRRGCAATVNDGLCMRSPFAGNGEFVTAGGTPAYQALIAALNANSAALPASLRQVLPALAALAPGAANANLSVIGFPSAQGPRVIAANGVQSIDPLGAQFNDTYELGYKGILRGRLRLAADLWYQQRGDVGTPAQLATPGVFMNRAQLGQFITTNLPAVLQAGGMSAPQAQGTAAAVGNAFASDAALAPLFGLPLGVVTFDDARLGTRSTDFLATYQMVGRKIYVYGSDVAADFLANDRVTLTSTYSYLSRNVFDAIRDPSTGVPFMANSPRHRAAVRGRYESPRGWGTELGGRYTASFPVNSAVYVSNVPFQVAGTSPAQTFTYPDVPVNMFVDAGVSYRFLVGGRRALLSVNGTNILDNKRQSFVGVPEIGRLLITRLRYEF